MKFLISYRREDSQGLADRLYERLTAAFGKARVFKDVDSIPAGEDFAEHIAASIAKADVVLILIGERWLSCANIDGEPKLWREGDVVRFEIETALAQGKRIIPILVGAAPMPTDAELPPSIRRLTAFNAARVRFDPDFNQDCARLIRQLFKLNTPLERIVSRAKKLTIPMCVLAFTGTGVFFLPTSPKSSSPAPVAKEPARRPNSTDLVIQFGTQVTIEGKFFFQKYYTDASDPTYKGRTAFLPIILSDRMMVFEFSNLDKGFLNGEPPGPQDRIELRFSEGVAKDAHEAGEGKRGRVWGSVVMDNENRLLPVMFSVDRLELLE